MHSQPEAEQGSFAGVVPVHRTSGLMVSAMLCCLLLRQERGQRDRTDMEQGGAELEVEEEGGEEVAWNKEQCEFVRGKQYLVV